jgi:Ni/Fe-hydrogenase subunit HybB-like protein
MSTEPSWTSTAYGVYGFASSFQAGIAAIALLALGLVSGHAAGPKIRHDLGKLLFAFSTFWAYVWFCQYMLIWYTNLPEEVPYYTRRMTSQWAPLFWLSPLLGFVVPFILLLSAKAKRNPVVLGFASIVVLAGRWLDAYLQIAPARHTAPPAPLFALAAGVAVLAGMALLIRRAWPGRGLPPPAPLRDGP